MNLSLLRAALVSVVATASVLMTAGPAAAQTLVIHDEVGDVWTWDDEAGKAVPAGSVRNADLTRLKVAHSDRKVKVWARYDNLRNVEEMVFLGLGIRTNENVRRNSFVFNFSPRRDLAVLTDRRGREVRCAGLDADIQYHRDEVELVVPRSCLSRPDWVQVRGFAAALRITEGATAEEPPVIEQYLDAAGKTGWKPNTWSPRLTRG